MKIKRKYKTVVQRWAAAFIDGIVFLPFNFIIDRLSGDTLSGRFFTWQIIYLFLWLSYSVYMHGRYGQTLGKMASDIKVFDVDEKSMIGYKRALWRELPLLIATIGVMVVFFFRMIIYPRFDEKEFSTFENWILYATLAAALIEFVTMLTNNKRRAVHDYIAGSVVLDITKYKKWEIEYAEMMHDAEESNAQTG